jgi:hypothetical protein
VVWIVPNPSLLLSQSFLLPESFRVFIHDSYSDYDFLSLPFTYHDPPTSAHNACAHEARNRMWYLIIHQLRIFLRILIPYFDYSFTLCLGFLPLSCYLSSCFRVLPLFPSFFTAYLIMLGLSCVWLTLILPSFNHSEFPYYVVAYRSSPQFISFG